MRTYIFYNWVPVKLHFWILLILLICLTLNTGISPSISNYIIGDLSAIPADLSMVNAASAVGLICAVPLVLRLSQFIPDKTIYLISFPILILTNLVISFTDEPLILVISAFVYGFVRIVALLAVLAQLLPILMPNGERYQLYAVYYFSSLLFPQIGSFVVNILADRFTWQLAQTMFLLQLFAGMLVIIACCHNERLGKKIPLYQFDWLGTALLAVFLLMFGFILSYGVTEDWFNSLKIQGAAILTIFSLTILLARTFDFKRPVLALHILRYNNVSMGLIVLFMMGLFFATGGIQTTLMAIVLKNNPLESSRINMYLIPGFIIGNAFCFFYYRKYNNFKLAIVIACTCYVISYIQMYFVVSLNSGPSDFYLPMFFRGAGNIVAFTAMGIYLAYKIPFKHFFSVVLFYLGIRSFMGPIIWSAVLNELYYTTNVKNVTLLANKMDRLEFYGQERYNGLFGTALSKNNNVNFAANDALQNLYKQVNIQASLLAVKEIFGWVIITGILMIVVILIINVEVKDGPETHHVLP